MAALSRPASHDGRVIRLVRSESIHVEDGGLLGGKQQQDSSYNVRASMKHESESDSRKRGRDGCSRCRSGGRENSEAAIQPRFPTRTVHNHSFNELTAASVCVYIPTALTTAPSTTFASTSSHVAASGLGNRTNAVAKMT